MGRSHAKGKKVNRNVAMNVRAKIAEMINSQYIEIVGLIFLLFLMR